MNTITSKKLYVGNLSVIVDEVSLRCILQTCGNIVGIEIVMNENSRSRRCYAVVEMSTYQEANVAVEKINGSVFNGRTLAVKKL